jgi:uncharacterized circularly permuted ATP-grasp superfamily protein
MIRVPKKPSITAKFSRSLLTGAKNRRSLHVFLPKIIEVYGAKKPSITAIETVDHSGKTVDQGAKNRRSLQKMTNTHLKSIR